MISYLLMPLLPTVAFLVSFVFFEGLTRWLQYRVRMKDRKSPLSIDMLRPPGHSLRKTIRELNFEIASCLVMLFVMPLLGFSVYLSQSYFAELSTSLTRIIAVVIGVLAFMIYFTHRLMKLLSIRDRFELGMEGEMFTGQELDQLMLDGYRVFHDIPMDYGNIDHVVVGPSGVYAIETKTFAKATHAGSKVVVDFNQNVLRFPDRSVRIPVDQLQTTVRWLEQYIGKPTGTAVSVKSKLALPGWFIDRREGNGHVDVFSPRNAKARFPESQRLLSSEMIDQIARQLERLCRDVAPAQKENKAWTQAS